jgi:hypothetical protein
MATIGPRGRVGSGGVVGWGLGTVVVVVEVVIGSPRKVSGGRLKPRRPGTRAQSGMIPKSGSGYPDMSTRASGDPIYGTTGGTIYV